MIRAGAALSRQADTAAAARQAVRQALHQAGLGRADAVLLFATPSHARSYDVLLQEVSRAAGTHNIAGGSGQGVLGPDDEIESGPGVALLVLASGELELRAGVSEALRDRAAGCGREVALEAQPGPAAQQGLVLAMPDTMSCDPEAFLAGFQGLAPGVPLFGGGTSGGAGGSSFQLYGNQAHTNAVAYLALRGRFTVVHGITQACFPVAPPLVITRAAGRLVYELGGKPAYAVLAELLRGPVFQGPRRPHALFAGISVDPSQTFERGQYLIRNLAAVDPQRGVIGLSAPVATGQSLAFMVFEPARARDDLLSMLDDLRRHLAGATPRFGLYFNCCSRGSTLYHEVGVDPRLLKQAFPELPIIGFATGFELAPIGAQNFLHLYSGILVVVAE